MSPHPLTNFEIIKYYENQSRFNGVYSRDNLPSKIKDGAYVMNLDEYSGIDTHWIALYVKNNDINYFDSFCVEHIPKEMKAFIKKKNIKTNIFRSKHMCGYFCIGFINFMFKGKTLTKYTNLFSPYDFKRNDDIILNYFMSNTYLQKMESYCLKCKKHTKNIDPQVSSTSNGKLMILSKGAICGSKKIKFIKKEDAKGLLSKLGITTRLSKVPILSDILF